MVIRYYRGCKMPQWLNAYLLKATMYFLHTFLTHHSLTKMLSFSSIFESFFLLTYIRKCSHSLQFFQNSSYFLLFSPVFPPPFQRVPTSNWFPFSFFSLPCANPFHSQILSIPSLSRGEQNSPLLACHVASKSDFIFNSLINFKYPLISYSLSLF